MLKIVFFVFLAISPCLCFAQWHLADSPTNASLRAIEAYNSKIIYASGSKGTLISTNNGGKTWKKIKMTNFDSLDFRGLALPSKNKIVLMSAGLGEDGNAKILLSSNKGKSFKMVYENQNTGVFFDAINFCNKNIGYIIGDAIDEKPFMLKTTNGGESWDRIPGENFPDIIKGEASYAASNSCIFSLPTGEVWFHTQNRVFKSIDFGKTWKTFNTPFIKGKSEGIFGIQFWNNKDGIIIGGDYIDDRSKYQNYALTDDGGKTWSTGNIANPTGLKEDATKLKNSQILLVGTSGTSISRNLGISFESEDSIKLHSISSYKNQAWACGPNGNLAKWETIKKK